MISSKGVLSRVGLHRLFSRQLSSKKHTLPTQKDQMPMVAIDENDMRESFVRGSGPGGQKINKSKNNVLLVHVPTGISVQCQETRDLCSNRKIARKLLRDKVDLAVNGETSKLGKKFERIRKKKRNSARRAVKKYGPSESETGGAQHDQSASSSSDSDSSDEEEDEERAFAETPK